MSTVLAELECFTRICFSRSPLWRKFFSQYEQLYGFSPVEEEGKSYYVLVNILPIYQSEFFGGSSMHQLGRNVFHIRHIHNAVPHGVLDDAVSRLTQSESVCRINRNDTDVPPYDICEYGPSNPAE